MSSLIGINADSTTINGDLSVLTRSLQRFAEAGFSHVEIPVHGLDCLIDGRLCEPRVAEVRRRLASFPLAYTVHGPDRLNLADERDAATHERALLATVDFAARIEASVVVYHGSFRTAAGSESEGSQTPEVWATDIEALRRVARHAESLGVTVAVENIFRQGPYERSYRIDPRNLAAVVAAVGSKAVGLCFDFGHAFISSKEEGFGIEEAFLAAVPYLAHVHIHDNFGKPQDFQSRTIDALFKGSGDLHLPPGWGSIPYESLMPLFTPSYRGVFMLEIQTRFGDRYEEALAWMSRFAGV